MILNKRTIRELNSLTVLSTDSIQQINNIINAYPIATQEDNLELIRQYREGNPEALELLIKINMRLIIKYAKIYQQKVSFYQLADLVQEVIIALMNAAETYNIVDPEAAFSTYFTNQTKFHVNREIRDNDDLVRRPAHLKSKISKYNKVTQHNEMVGITLSDEELKTELNLTDGNLKDIRADYKLNATSMDAKVDSSDDSSTELSEFISDGVDISNNVISGIVNNELFIYLKQTLSPLLFYILVSRVYDKKKLEDLGAEFAITRERIRQLEAKAFKKIKEHCPTSYELNYKLSSDENASILRGAPISPESIAQYMFFKDFLTEKERELFKIYIQGEYIPDENVFSTILGLDIDEYRSVKSSLFKKINDLPKETVYMYQCFKDIIIKKFGTKIYNIDWDMDLEEIREDMSYIFKIWDNKSYDEAIAIIKEKGIDVDPNLDKLLRQFFNYANIPQEETRKAEHDINSILFGTKKKDSIPHDKLYKTLEENAEEFTEEQYDYIMMQLFNRMSRKDFKNKYPYSPLLNGGGFYVIQRLEALYYNIANYKAMNFTKRKYLQIRDKCVSNLSKEQVGYLDLYFGHNCDEHTVFDIRSLLKIKYEEARDKLNNAKRRAQSIYLEKSGKKMVEADYYIPYIIDENIDLNDTHRKLLKGHLIDKLSYEELSKQLGMSKHDVSSNILDGLLKIDFHRFGILKKYEYPENIIKAALASPKISDDERNILTDLQNGMPRSEAAEKYGKKLQNIDTLCTKFTKICHTLAVGKRKPSKEDVKKELNIHQAANLLNENERILLSYTYGIKCDINPNGEMYTKQEFCQHFPTLSGRYSKLLNSGIETVRGKKLGIDRATLDIIDRKELRKIVLDPRLPISEKELELLSYTYEIRGYEYKNLNELAKMYNERATSIKRRIQRAVATIRRYQNDEIAAQISYTYDIENNLRFFTKNDREILIAKYRDNLSIDEIAKRFNLTYSQVETLLKNLDGYLKDILNEEINPFDFDYYYEVVDSEDFPYDDNLKMAKNIFNLYFEERLTAQEIKERLNLDESVSTIQRIIQSLILATSKRKDGIKKAHHYTYDDVANYYKQHSGNMDREQLRSYHRYFSKVDAALNSSENGQTIKKLPIAQSIILDLTIANNENAFSFETATREQAFDIVTKHKKELSENTIMTLAKAFEINDRECMDSQDKMKVLKFLKRLNLQSKCPINQPEEIAENQKQKVKIA